MKKILSTLLIIALISINLTACTGRANNQFVTMATTPSQSISTIETTPTPEPTSAQEHTTIPETTTAVETTPTSETSTAPETTTPPETTTIYETTSAPVTVPIFTTPERIDTVSAYSTAYSKSEETKDRTVVYFGKTRQFDSIGINWASSDTSVATVDNIGNVTAWSEGIADIICTDNAGNIVDTFEIFTTTYNDGRNPVKDAPRATEIGPQDITDIFCNGCTSEMLKNEINTIRDLMAYLCHHKFYYNSNMPICATRSCWTWAVSGEAVLELGYGVCCDIANVASYLLQYDYEELGWIYTCGDGVGHVFNYVYEDGMYYVFDLTEVICNNSSNYMSFPIYELKDLKEIMNTGKIALEDEEYNRRLLAVVAVESLNFEEQPAMYMSYMRSSRAIYTAEMNSIGFEEGVPFTVFYESPVMPLEWKVVPSNELPLDTLSWFRDYTQFRGYKSEN